MEVVTIGEENNVEVNLNNPIEYNFTPLKGTASVAAYLNSFEGYREETDSDRLLGVNNALITEKHRLKIPEEVDLSEGPAELGQPLSNTPASYTDPQAFNNLWITFRGQDFSVYIARATEDRMDWEDIQEIEYVPENSTNPTLTFTEEGEYLLAVEVRPSEEDNKEIWVIAPPYDSNSIDKVADGHTPKLLRTNEEESRIILFYNSLDRQTIYYREFEDFFDKNYILKEYDPLQNTEEQIKVKEGSMENEV